MHLPDVLDLARALMATHGVEDWELGLGRARRRAGQTDHARHRITLSRHLMGLYDEAEVRETILHEIAHARVGASHGHDAVWRVEAQRIGSTGRRELTIARNGTAHIGGIAFLVNRALAGHRTTAIRDATTITFADVHGEVLIQYNWPPQGTAYVSHHPPDPTNQRARPRPQEAPTVTEVLTHRTSPMS